MRAKVGIMNLLSSLANLAPYHLWIYGTLLGTELYQVRLWDFVGFTTSAQG